ncbi:MAG TPA: glycosyltransferase family 4 protein, partial [Acidimicrobiales bacterium]|nr:glycosyltransferase family 4 protein [Acidimicrobiales bacterium]
LLRADTSLAASSVVVLPVTSDAGAEYRQIGCRVEYWSQVELVHPTLEPANLVTLARDHSVGLRQVVKRLRALRPRAVVSNTESLWLGGLAARVLRLPHAQIFHTVIFDYRWSHRPAMCRTYLTGLGHLSTSFIAVSTAVADMLERYGAPSAMITVVPNAFDIGRLHESSERPLPAETARLLGGRPLLVSVGQLAEMKGQDILFDAVAELRHDYPQVTCLVVGRRLSDKGVEDTVSYEQRLRAQVASLGLAGGVHFLDEVDYVPSLLAAADVYVHPSRTESFSRVIAEAMACGCPVVATDVGGIPEVAGPAALLAPAGDAPKLAEQIRTVLTDTERRDALVEAGRRRISENYDAVAVSRRFADLLASLG